MTSSFLRPLARLGAYAADPLAGKRLDKPITLSGVVVYAPTLSREKIQAAVKARVAKEAIVLDGKVYRIPDCLVTVEANNSVPSANGEIGGEDNYNVMIIPAGVSVYPVAKH